MLYEKPMWVWKIARFKSILVDLNNGNMISRNGHYMGPLRNHATNLKWSSISFVKAKQEKGFHNDPKFQNLKLNSCWLIKINCEMRLNMYIIRENIRSRPRSDVVKWHRFKDEEEMREGEGGGKNQDLHQKRFYRQWETKTDGSVALIQACMWPGTGCKSTLWWTHCSTSTLFI